jgi:hypothetical protein
MAPKFRFRPCVELLEAREVPAQMVWLGQVNTNFSTEANWLQDGSPASRPPQAGDELHFSGSMTQTECVGLVGDPAGAYASITLQSAAPVYLGGDVVTGGLYLYGGEIRNQASGQDITVTDQFNWTAGKINPTWGSGPFTGELKLDGAIALIAPAGAGTVYLGSSVSLVNGAVATLGEGTISRTQGGLGFTINANCGLNVDPGQGKSGYLLSANVPTGGETVEIRANGYVRVLSGTWGNFGSVSNFSGEFTLMPGTGANFWHNEFTNLYHQDGSARMYLHAGSTLRTVNPEGNNHTITIHGGTLFTMWGNGFEPTVTIQTSTFRFYRGDIIAGDNAVGDNPRFGTLKVIGNVLWRGGTYRPFVLGENWGASDRWTITGTLVVNKWGTGAPPEIAPGCVDPENNQFDPPAGLNWELIEALGGITNQNNSLYINPAMWTIVPVGNNPVTKWQLRSV